ncbi:MAG: glycosyltransferase [Lachnospiraceae bacterium]|nr:glycosyltransferase [Lachnospiraceae bacterium]
MSEIELSIIIPAYNCKKYISHCISSLLDQDLESYEIIIIDDGSTDGTSSYCDQLATDVSIITVIHKKNEGQGIARNLGIQMAKGRFIAFVDADDIPCKKAYGSVIKAISNRMCDLCVCNWMKLSSNNTRIYNQNKDYHLQNISGTQAIREMSTGTGFFSSAVWNKIYKRDILLNNGIVFTSERDVISEDFLFNYDYIHAIENIVMLDINLYGYRVNDESFCHKYQPQYYNRLINLKKALTVREVPLNEEQFIYEKLYSFVKTCIIQEVQFHPYKKSIASIQEICESVEVKNILKNIEVNCLDHKNRVIYCLITVKMYAILYILYKCKK